MTSAHAKIYTWDESFPLTLGGSLPQVQVAYEMWGELNAARDNAVLLFTGLSASAHAKSHGKDDPPGWWEAIIGSGLGLDTDRYCVICFNHLGGCFGSSGPSSIDPRTGEVYGRNFPELMVQDIAASAGKVVDHLGIQRVYAVVGASMGGMVAMEYAAMFSAETARLIMISASGRPGPTSIAFRFLQRQIVMNDPAYAGGWYYDKDQKPTRGMAVARMLGNITYRSRREFNERFGRSRTGEGYSMGVDFQIESYLHHMGYKLADNFDANSFLLLSKSMDLYSLGYGFPTYEQGVARITAKSLIVGVNSDMLFAWEEQEDVYKTLRKLGRDARFEMLSTPYGHDAFLVEVDWFRATLSRFLEEA